MKRGRGNIRYNVVIGFNAEFEIIHWTPVTLVESHLRMSLDITNVMCEIGMEVSNLSYFASAPALFVDYKA